MIEKHRSAFEYDWWTRFGRSLSVVGRSMSWGEAIRLTRILRADPSSMLASTMEGWAYPLPREIAVLMDLYDLTFAATGAKNRKPYPRPYAEAKQSKRSGDAGGRSPEEVIRVLREQFGRTHVGTDDDKAEVGHV